MSESGCLFEKTCWSFSQPTKWAYNFASVQRNLKSSVRVVYSLSTMCSTNPQTAPQPPLSFRPTHTLLFDKYEYMNIYNYYP